MRVLKTIKYKVWDRVYKFYDESIHIDQDGTFFSVSDGWNCEGGGGYDNPLDQDRYEVHLDD